MNYKHPSCTQEQGGLNWSDIDLTIRTVTADGRIAGVVQSYRAGQYCNRPLRASGIVKDGSIEIDAKEGAPVGYERSHALKMTAEEDMSDTLIFNGKTYDVQFKRK